jgi:hypothetical protein
MKMARLSTRESTGAWLPPSCTLQRHGRTFSSLCLYVRAFRLPHALHTGQQFIGFSGISNTHSSLEFDILLLLCWILLIFPMLILLVVGLTERALLVLVIFWIFSHLLIFSKIIFSYLIHHRGWVCSCCSQNLWNVHTMRDFEEIFERVPLLCDNTSVISIAKNLVFHKRMRHHFLSDHVKKGDIERRYIDTER